LQEVGRFEDALADYDRAIALAPRIAPFHNNRGFALYRLKRFEDAVSSIDQALGLNPNYPLAHKNRGEVLSALKRPAEALQSYDRAIALNPKAPEALNDRGNVLKELDRLQEALDSYDAAIAVEPGLPETWYNRGIVFLELKRPQDALASYDRAIALKPDYYEALAARGLCKLAMGNFATGWRDYENRWRVATHPKLHAPTDAPLWSGDDLRDRSILVCSERGLGDIIQFSRYVTPLVERGARVTFLVPDKLKRILGDLSVRTISAITDSDRFDVHCALMSLPHLLDVTPADSPLSIPYLAVDAERVGHWKRRIGAHGFRIGICWQGAAWQGGASIKGRAIPLSEFRSLSAIEGVRLISLQKGDGVEQLATAGVSIETLGDDFDAGLDAFVDTIAAMEHLDLIVTCDTSIAHVAGARSEVDRVLDSTVATYPRGRVTTLAESRTAVLLGEILDLVGTRPELHDPRLRKLLDYDRKHSANAGEKFLSRFLNGRGRTDGHDGARDSAHVPVSGCGIEPPVSQPRGLTGFRTGAASAGHQNNRQQQGSNRWRVE